MRQKRILLLLMAIFAISFAYGQETDEKLEKAEALCKEGVTLHDEGKYEEAIKKYDEALKVKPDYYLAMTEKAYSLYSIDKKSDAKKILEKIIKKQPTDFDISHSYLIYANIVDDEGDQLKALETYDKALEKADEENVELLQQIYYNYALVLSKLTDVNKTRVEDWEQKMYFYLENSLKCQPYHPRSIMLCANIFEENGSFAAALSSYAIFAMAADDAADLLEPKLLAWKDLALDSVSGPRTLATFNKVNEILKKEPSEYGLLYDIFKEALPLACPDTLGQPVPAVYASDIFDMSYEPFFAELHRRGLLECFCHSIMKNSKSKYISNANWLTEHKDEEKRMWQMFRDLKTFSSDIKYGYVPDSIDFTTAEEAHLKIIDAMACCNYYLNHSSESDYMSEASKYITTWTMLSPDVTIKIGDAEAAFVGQPEYLVAYIAGCTFAALASGKKEPTQESYSYGLNAVLYRYLELKEKYGKNDFLDKLQNLYDNDIDGYKKYIEENYNK